MKAALPIVCGLLVAIAAAIVAAAEKPPTRGEAVAVNVDQGPDPAKLLDDPLWQKCEPWPLGDCTSSDPLKHKTWAKALFDGSFAYVAVHCDEPDTAGMPSSARNHDDPVWNDDSVEVFLRPDPQEPYCQWIVNSRGTLYDARGKDPAWDSGAEVRTKVEPGKAWTAVMKVPLEKLGAFVGDGQTWTANVHRTRHARGGEPALQYAWSVMSSADYHNPREFGVIGGIDIPKRADGVTRTRATPAPQPVVLNRGVESGGVTVYHKMTFDANMEGWTADNGARLTLGGDAADGRALRVACDGPWGAAVRPIQISGSRDLKMALLMKGEKLESAGINVYDSLSADNTTAYGYRVLGRREWTPILYRLDLFRYNSQQSGHVGPATLYGSVRLHAPSEAVPGRSFAIDNVVIYRGEDRRPPEKVTGLKAVPRADGVELSWNPAEDNVAAQLYVVARAEGGGSFTKIAESMTTRFVDRTAGRGTHRYRVFAVDFEENYGPWSDAVSVESVSQPRERKLTREEQDRLGFAEHVRRVHARGKGRVRRNHATLFGDSLTAATSYPDCARAAFGTLTVNAFGYPSMRTGFGRERVGEILERDNPEFMFILYGTNNDKAETHLPAAMDDLAAIVKSCEERGTVAVLGTIPPRGWTEESAPEAGFNRHVVALCRKAEIPTGYVFEAFQAAGDRRHFMGSDGVHWRGEGMALGAAACAKALDEIRFVIRDQP